MHAPKRFKLKRATYLVMSALAMVSFSQLAAAGAGWADNVDKAGVPFKQPTFYANSPSGIHADHAPTALPGATRDTGTALRKFIDNLPLIDGYSTNAALLTANAPGATGRHIPLAVREDVTPLLLSNPAAHSVTFPDADYYEIAVVEYREQLHSDLPPVVKTPSAAVGQGPVVTGGTTLRGYVQIWTPRLPATVAKSQLFYLDGKPILDNQGNVVFAVGDGPHYLGPVIDSQSGVPVRLKFDNYLPKGHYDPITKTRGGDIFIPTDKTLAGAGLGPLGAIDPNAPQPFERYTENRALIHLHGGDTPWISDGEPHSWITPAGENTLYPVGETTQNVPDMPDPGPGSQTYFFPNNQSARMEWYHDHSAAATRINVYAGIVSAFMIHDATEAGLKAAGGALAGMDEIPLIFEDKTFVPKDVTIQDAKWSTDAWGHYGDLWFPHVYETNQNPNSIDGTNPAGRWDYGPWFWPVFPAPLALPSGNYGDASGTQESFADTPLINGIAYPNFNVEPKPYRFRLLNASLQRYLNIGLYVADPLSLGVLSSGQNYSQPAIPANPLTAAPAVAGTTVAISPDLNGQVPTATLQISPIGAPAVTMLAGGAGYSAAATVTFSGGGALVQATGHLVVSGGVIRGVVVDTAGSGYTSAPNVAFADATGAGALATANLTPGGEILAITLDPAPAGVVYSYAAPPTITVTDPTAQGTGATFIASLNTEVPMVPAVQPAVNPAYAVNTYDGRPGGIPDPKAMGPNIIQIGSEGGFLAQPNVIPSTPVSYQQLRRIVTVLNVLDHGLYVGPAERADFVVDFSQFAGKTLIVYNDCPAPNPGFDARVDYYTGDLDQTASGGADTTLPGYGPNTRTMMRINVAAAQFNGTPAPAPYDPLNNGGPLAAALPAAFAASQDQPIVPQSWQNAAYGTTYTDNLAHIYAGSFQQPTFNFNTAGIAQTLTGFTVDSAGASYTVPPTVTLTGGLGAGGVPATAHAVLDAKGNRVKAIVLDTPGAGYINAPTVTLSGGDGIGASASAVTTATSFVNVLPKGIQELFDPNYGRMNATFSAELPFTSVLTQTTIPVGYIDPPTEHIGDGETQFWKITHNGVDTHVVHFHLFNVQVINRVAWDGTIVALDPAEFGWKETVKMNPLEDIYVAVKPKSPKAPFGVPQSIRALDPTQPIGATAGFSHIDPKTGLAATVTNQLFNFDWEYVWHCHILGHEENDFMRPIVFSFGTLTPPPVVGVSYNAGTQSVTWTDPTPIGAATTYGNKQNEQGFLIQRTDNGNWPALPASTPQSAAQASLHPDGYLQNVVSANATAWVDPVPASATTQYRVLAFNSAGYSESYTPTQPGNGAAGLPGNSLLTGYTGLPNAPTALKAAVGAYNALTSNLPITLTWSASPPPKNGFVIKRTGGFTANGTAIPEVTFTVATVANQTAYTFTDTTSAEMSAYNYAVFADNGTVNAPLLSPASSVQIFTPYATPPVVTGVSAKVDPSGNAITINWTMPASVTPDAANVPASPHVTGFDVVRVNAGVSTTFSVPQLINPLAGTIASPVTYFVDTAPVTGASTYTVFAVNGNITSTSAVPSSSTTVALNAVAAPGMQGVSATANSPTQVTINWAPAPQGSTVTGFQITRTAGAATVALVTPAGIATSFVDTTAQPNVSYTYTVQWLNAGNAGIPGTSAPVTTAYAAAMPVTALTVLPVAAANGTAFTNTLNWTGNPTAATFAISRCVATAANANCTNASTVFTTLAQGIAASTYADTTATVGNIYVYQVQSVNGNGSSVSAGVMVSVYDVAPPAAPTAPLTTISSGSILVSWTASASNTTTSYLIERSADNGLTWSLLNTVAAPAVSYTDGAVVVGNSYLYRITAQAVVAPYPAVKGQPSVNAPAVYTVQNAPTISSPTAVIAGVAGAPTVTFAFGQTARAGAPAVTGYQVYRNTGTGFLPISAVLPTTTTSFTDTAPALNLTNVYEVMAVNVLGNSLPSNTLTSVMTVPAAPAITSTAPTYAGTAAAPTVSFNFTVTQAANVPPVTGFQVYRSVGAGAGFVPVGAVLPATATSFTDTSPVGGLQLQYQVVAINLVGPSLASNTMQFQVAVQAAPVITSTAPVLGTTAAGALTVSFNFTETPVNTAPGVSGFQVYRNVGAGFVPLGPVLLPTITSFTDTAPVAGANNQYYVVALNLGGASVPSNTLSAGIFAPTAPAMGWVTQGVVATTRAVVPGASQTAVGNTTSSAMTTTSNTVVRWTPGTVSVGTPPVSGYLVFAQINGAVDATGKPVYTQLTPTPITNATQANVTTAVGNTYTFSVRAVNAVGQSADPTLPVTVVNGESLTVASATRNAPAGTSTTDTVVVNWKPTDTNVNTSATAAGGSQPVTGYQVQYATSSSFAGATSVLVPVAAATAANVTTAGVNVSNVSTGTGTASLNVTTFTAVSRNGAAATAGAPVYFRVNTRLANGQVLPGAVTALNQSNTVTPQNPLGVILP